MARRRPLTSRACHAAVVAACWGVVGSCIGFSGLSWMPSPSSRPGGGRRALVVGRSATERKELYLPTSDPKARQVMDVYNKLLGEKDEQKAKGFLDSLDNTQRLMLKGLIEAKGGADKPLTTSEPQLGDTPERLYKKLQQLGSDEEVSAWRQKLDPVLAQAVQEIIEVEQSKLADAEAALQHDDEAIATAVWERFKVQFPVPSANGRYFSTPCRENDIKYRYRRMRENLGIDGETVLQIAEKDSAPFLTDPDFVRRTWKAMVAACDGPQDALENLVLKHPGLLIARGEVLKDQINQARVTASLIDATSGVGKFFRNLVSENRR